MIRTTNLFAFTSICDEEVEQSCLSFLGTEFRATEIEIVRLLCNYLRQNGVAIADLNDFFVGFKIPQISKEFDLLKIGDYIINIEIKSRYNGKIAQQLKRNRYYLQFLQKEILLFTYCANENKLYTLDEQESLIETNVEQLVNILKMQKDIFHGNLKDLFNPYDFLVSPFNSMEKFLNNEYFLTPHQEEITANVLEIFDEDRFNIISIRGKAGTGKTLLLYHIAKELQKRSSEVLIIHVGKLNSGQRELSLHDWKIIPVKILESRLTGEKNAVLVDEAQRIQLKQLNSIIEYARKNKVLCIFSHDEAQTLKNAESIMQISANIDERTRYQYELRDKIRTNKEIADFINVILGKKKERIHLSSNASVVFFNDMVYARNYISSKANNEWIYIAHTPSIFSENTSHFDKLLNISEFGTAHDVIGQEFDNVITVIDSTFYYDLNGKLQSRGLPNNPYNRRSMFFQAVTRVRQRLEIVVVDNIDVYKRILSFFE